MSDEASAPAAAPEGGETQAPAGAAPAETLDAETLSLLEGAPANDNGGSTEEPTIKIGGHDIPLSAIDDLPDDVLRRVKRKIKAGGEEMELSLLEALERAPRAHGIERKAWELAQQRKQMDELVSGIGADPIAAYAAIHGLTRSQATKAIAKAAMDDLDYEAMPAEERAKVDRQRELERKAKLADEYERAELSRRQEAEAQQAQRTIGPMIQSALPAAGLPADAEHVSEVARELSAMMDAGLFDAGRGQVRAITAEDVAEASKAVAARASKLVNHRVSDVDSFITANPALARKIAQAVAKQVRGAQTPQRAPEGTKVRAAADSNAQPTTFAEFQAMRNRKLGIF